MSGLPSGSILNAWRLSPWEVGWWGVALGVWFVFPEYLGLGVSVLIMVMFVLSYDLLLGYAGILTLGHTAFFGLGAFAAARLSLAGWTEPVSSALLGAAFASLVAALSGPYLLRLSGLALMMVTLAANVLLFEAAHKAAVITGGDDGLNGIRFAPIFGVFRWGLGGKTQYLYVLAWLLLVYVGMRRLTASPFGVVLQGIRDNPGRMRLAGSNTVGHLSVAFAISAGVAGLAGALLTQTTAFVSLGVFAIDNSINVLVMLVLGGLGNLYGSLVGAPLYMLLRHFTAQWSPFYWMFVVGLLLMVVVLLGRGGALGLLRSALERTGGRGRA